MPKCKTCKQEVSPADMYSHQKKHRDTRKIGDKEIYSYYEYPTDPLGDQIEHIKTF